MCVLGVWKREGKFAGRKWEFLYSSHLRKPDLYDYLIHTQTITRLLNTFLGEDFYSI
jgi:hypothetical protein